MVHADMLDPEDRLEALGAYRLEALLGAAPFRHIYLGTHSDLRNSAVVEVVTRSIVDSPALVDRVIHETRATNDLRHPNIAETLEVIDVGDPRHVGVVRPYLRGATLDQPRRFTAEQSFSIALQLVAALEAAHAIGVVHGNLGPSDLNVGEDENGLCRLRVLGFGYAHLAGRTDPNTNTPYPRSAYLAPEQRDGEIVVTPSDTFAVGMLLRDLLGGAGDDALAHLDLPGADDVRAAIRGCLAHDPDARPALTEVRKTLEALCPPELAAEVPAASESTATGPHKPSGEWTVVRMVSRPSGASIRRVGSASTIATTPYDLVVSADVPTIDLELALDGHATRRVRVATSELERIVDLPIMVCE